MSQVATFSDAQVEQALAKMGVSDKDMKSGNNLLRFADDQDKCRTFCEHLQGPDAVYRTDPTFMSRYQARAERVIRTYAKYGIPSDLDINKERYKDMAKSSAKRKAVEETASESKKSKRQAVEVAKGEPKWFGKFGRRGIAFRMAVLLHRVEGEAIPGEEKISKVTGATKVEMLEDLLKSFPDGHNENSLRNNINIELSSLQARLGKKVKRVEDEKRGMVYSF